MRRLAVVIICIFLLVGCGGTDGTEKAIDIRNRLLSGGGCEFLATVTADYGKKLYSFSMICKADDIGNLTFSVLSPETIAGITGTVNSVGGELTFDNKALAFPVLADGQISPVSAPWFFLTALRSGYMKACELTEDGLHMIVNDSYAQDVIQVDIYTNSELLPVRADLLWQGRRIVSLDIENYKHL